MEKYSGIIIAAGFSSRMGSFKPLLLYREKPFIVNIIDKLSLVAGEIVIVTGNEKEKLRREILAFYYKSGNEDIIKKINFVFNPSYEKGMFTSLQAGLKQARSYDGYIYHFTDQPHIPDRFYYELVLQAKGYNWAQPSFKGKKGHPVILDKKAAGLILSADPGSNLKLVSSEPGLKKNIWECDYPEVLEDADTPEDYKKIKGD